jgi:hypothetical protein
MFLRELRAREICVTAELNVYFSERLPARSSGSSGGTVPTEAFLIDDLKSCFVEEGRDSNSRVVLIYRRRIGIGGRPVVFHISALELARLNPVLSSMAQRRNISVQHAIGRGSFKSRRSMSRSTAASDSADDTTPPGDLDDSDENDSRAGFAPRSAKKVTVLIGKVTLGVPARMDLDKACDVCNFLVGFGVSKAEFQEFANKLARKNRLVEIKDGMVGARGLGVLSRSMPDLIEFRRHQEALAEAENALREVTRRSAKTVVSNVVTSAVLALMPSA